MYFFYLPQVKKVKKVFSTITDVMYVMHILWSNKLQKIIVSLPF